MRKSQEKFQGNSQELFLNNFSLEISLNFPKFGRHVFRLFSRVGNKIFPGIGHMKFLGMGYVKFLELFLDISADFLQNCYLGEIRKAECVAKTQFPCRKICKEGGCSLACTHFVIILQDSFPGCLSRILIQDTYPGYLSRILNQNTYPECLSRILIQNAFREYSSVVCQLFSCFIIQIF